MFTAPYRIAYLQNGRLVETEEVASIIEAARLWDNEFIEVRVYDSFNNRVPDDILGTLS